MTRSIRRSYLHLAGNFEEALAGSCFTTQKYEFRNFIKTILYSKSPAGIK